MRRLALAAALLALPALAPAYAEEGEHAEHADGHEPVCTAAAGDEECLEYWEHNVNWWSWDYRAPVKDPSHRHMPPPFGFALINFAVFGLIMYRLAARPLRDFVRTRHTTIKRDLDEAAAAKAAASAKLREYEAKIAGIEDEVARLVAQVKREAEEEKQRLIAQAAEQAKRLREDAEAQVRAEVRRIERALKREAVESALATAEKVLREKLSGDDQKKLADRYVADLEGHRATTSVRS